MKIISINTGSSSLKFSLFDMSNDTVIASGLFERIGIDGSCYTIKFNGEKIEEEIEMNSHIDAVRILLDKLISLDIINSLNEINGVGHRLAHGKEKYKESVVITDEVMSDFSSYTEFAPIHIPSQILGVDR